MFDPRVVGWVEERNPSTLNPSARLPELFFHFPRAGQLLWSHLGYPTVALLGRILAEATFQRRVRQFQQKSIAESYRNELKRFLALLDRWFGPMQASAEGRWRWSSAKAHCKAKNDVSYIAGFYQGILAGGLEFPILLWLVEWQASQH